MACTTFNCPSCGISYAGACCPTCQPAQSIYQGECSDPGTLTIGRFLPVLDYKFCERRLTNGPGFLVSNQNGSGNFGIGFTTTPQVELGEVAAAEDTAFGQLIVMGSDFRWRALQAPVAAGLFMQTNATGDVIFADPPAAVVPDPLVVNELTVTTTATVNDLTTNGTVTLNNLATGTVVNLLGVDASNEVVLQAISAGIAMSMFFESPTSPNSGIGPNEAKVSGDYLVIGNRIYDSGGGLINVTTSESITVAVAGKYKLEWTGEVRCNGLGKAGIWLEINGIIVNWGNGRTDGRVTQSPQQIFNLFGMEVRPLSVGDVIKLQLSQTGGGATYETFEVRLVAEKFSD